MPENPVELLIKEALAMQTTLDPPIGDQAYI